MTATQYLSDEQIEAILERFDFEGYTNPNIALVAFARTVVAAYLAKGAEPVAYRVWNDKFCAYAYYDAPVDPKDLAYESSRYGPLVPLHAAPLSEVKAEQSEEAYAANGLAWAVSKWNDEVSRRPMVNVHRRTLDDTWRQVISYFGGDHEKLVGPSHDAIYQANGNKL